MPRGRPKGGSKLAAAKLNLNEKTQINSKLKISRVATDADIDTRKYYCTCCGKGYTTPKGNFYKSNSQLYASNDGYVQVCKNCCEKYYEQLVEFYCGNEEKALDRICQLFDFYYNDQAVVATGTGVYKGVPRVSLYSSRMNMIQVKNLGTDYLQTIRDRLEDENKILEIDDVPDEADEESEEFVVTKSMIRTWGRGYTPEEYEYLEEQYADWIAKNVCNTKSQEEIYKNIVMAQLNIRRAQRNGGKVADAQKALQDLMSSAAILPRQTAENVLADTQTFGTLLEKYEKTRPLPEPAEEWKDVDGIRKYMNTWFRGGLSKALHIKNENAALYDEAVKEMEKYTVHRDNNVMSSEGYSEELFGNVTQSGDVDDESTKAGGE